MGVEHMLFGSVSISEQLLNGWKSATSYNKPSLYTINLSGGRAGGAAEKHVSPSLT